LTQSLDWNGAAVQQPGLPLAEMSYVGSLGFGG
jgi:hypothetical protein